MERVAVDMNRADSKPELWRVRGRTHFPTALRIAGGGPAASPGVQPAPSPSGVHQGRENAYRLALPDVP